ncbi:hypothetical protein [Lysobacter silvisoli]|uniref:Uncharacterized protein n=1 Tax=Lysobacter silvisoli TaxID=2293254 RepID=A0A371JWW7_9GAMM|nr:hypothetical protein [Lysobacter silvisoli]RDZ26159.1 hypothetical protein DX914_17965 [Lysobacter silvisoli]
MPDPRARALELFDQYVELAPRERVRALAVLSVAEPAVHAALVALLRADDRHRRPEAGPRYHH